MWTPVSRSSSLTGSCMHSRSRQTRQAATSLARTPSLATIPLHSSLMGQSPSPCVPHVHAGCGGAQCIRCGGQCPWHSGQAVTILWRLNNKAAKVQQQAADLISRIANVMMQCGEVRSGGAVVGASKITDSGVCVCTRLAADDSVWPRFAWVCFLFA